jgi:hypothetical protein
MTITNSLAAILAQGVEPRSGIRILAATTHHARTVEKNTAHLEPEGIRKCCTT